MLFAMMFAFWRFLQIITLIPTMGMLAYFVDGYVKSNALTPNFILVLFIVSVLALAWAIFTLFSYHRSSTNAMFVAVVDLGFVGALIAGIWYLRFIANADCTHITRGDSSWSVNFGVGSASFNDLDANTDKTCAMLKACFAFAIMNAVFFFITSILAWMHGGRMSSADRKGTYYRRETHYSRHGHRHSRSPHSRHSHHSRRSSRSHSHRRVHV